MSRDREKTRKGLVEAALEEFQEQGYFGTDTNRLARRAGYAPQTFYRYFGDKLEIFLEAYEAWGEELWKGVELAFEGEKREDISRGLVLRVLSHHRKFFRFRASLRALAATHEKVLQAQATQRSRQLEAMSRLQLRIGLEAHTQEQRLLFLLSMERVCDALAIGEIAALQMDEDRVIDALVRQMQEFLFGGAASDSQGKS